MTGAKIEPLTATTERLAYTVSEAASLAGVSRPTMYKWVNMAGFPVARIGGCTRIPAEAFKRWLEQQAAQPDGR